MRFNIFYSSRTGGYRNYQAAWCRSAVQGLLDLNNRQTIANLYPAASLPGEFGRLVQPCELLWVCNRVDPRGSPVLHDEAHRGEPIVDPRFDRQARR